MCVVKNYTTKTDQETDSLTTVNPTNVKGFCEMAVFDPLHKPRGTAIVKVFSIQSLHIVNVFTKPEYLLNMHPTPQRSSWQVVGHFPVMLSHVEHL